MEFSKYDESVKSGSNWPTGHKGEFFLFLVTIEHFYIPWLNYFLFFNNIGEFFLIEVDDNFITKRELIEEDKDTVVFSFHPGIIRAMTKYKGISFFSWFRCSWVTNNSFLKFSHEDIFHMVEIKRGIYSNVYEGDIFSNFRYNNTIIIRGDIEIDIEFRSSSNKFFWRKTIFSNNRIAFCELLFEYICLFLFHFCIYPFAGIYGYF